MGGEVLQFTKKEGNTNALPSNIITYEFLIL
jgi:hypothetical protein